MTTDIFCFYLQNRLIQTSQTGGQQYSDTSHFSIPCMDYPPTIRVLTKKGSYSPLGLSDLPKSFGPPSIYKIYNTIHLSHSLEVSKERNIALMTSMKMQKKHAVPLK